ncbi:MAG: thiosulfate oxidation carrier protein SoxY [Burkholderiaceae bacterium]|jgi:sulfur-oxidizing protein SoxY|nr:thiosulfate oxidation carrier protein SoxY [Betaproteobacteria bacterium]
MSMNRREVLKVGGGAAVYSALASMGFFAANPAMAAWNKAAFETKSIADTLKVLGVSGTANSADVVITSPDIAENGAVVPVGVASKIGKTEMIAVMVEKNPSMMAGMYQFGPNAEADISMRVKMGQSSDVYALVKADGKFYMTKKEIKVTLGGCGG